MARRSMTLKRIDPWSVLKFSLLANVVFLGVLLLAGRVAWFVITRLELVDKVCEVAESLAFENCGVDGGAVFQNALMLGLLAVVVQTGIFVFLAFLHNLLAELTGGITVTLDDPNATVDTTRRGVARAAVQASDAHAAAAAAAAPARSTVGATQASDPAGPPASGQAGQTPVVTSSAWGASPTLPRPAQPSATSPGPSSPSPAAPSPSSPSPSSPSPASSGPTSPEPDDDELFPKRRSHLHGPDRP